MRISKSIHYGNLFFLAILSICLTFGSCKKDNGPISGAIPNGLLIDTITPKYVTELEFAKSYRVNQGIKTQDNGFLIVGTIPNYKKAGFVFKTTNKGDTVWTRTLNKTNAQYGYGCLSAVQCKDGSYLILCAEMLYIKTGIEILKLSSTGETLWKKEYLGNVSYIAKNAIIEQANNQYVISGSRNNISEAYLLCINNQGDSLWSTAIPKIKEISAVNSIQNSKLAVLGLNKNETEGYLSTVGASGNIVTQYKVSGSRNHRLQSIAENKSGNLFVSSSVTRRVINGTTHQDSNYTDISRYDQNGNSVWQYGFSGGRSWIYPWHIINGKNDQMIVLINTPNFSELPNNIILKFDNTNTLVSKRYLEEFEGRIVIEEVNGNITLIGHRVGIAIVGIEY